MGKKLSLDEINTIIDSYDKYSGLALRASKGIGFNKKTIIKYWRERGFPISKSGPPQKYSQEKLQEIIDSYDEFDGNALAASRALNISSEIVRSQWKKKGLKAQGNIKKKYRGYESPLEYFNNQFSAKEIENFRKRGRSKFMQSYPTLCRALYRYNQIDEAFPKKFDSGRHLSLCDIEKIVKSYDECHGNPNEAKRRLNFAKETIIKYWKEHGLEPRRNKRIKSARITETQKINKKTTEETEYQRFKREQIENLESNLISECERFKGTVAAYFCHGSNDVEELRIWQDWDMDFESIFREHLFRLQAYRILVEQKEKGIISEEEFSQSILKYVKKRRTWFVREE